MCADIINNMIKIDQPPREKACQRGRSGAMHGVTSQADSSRSNDVSESSHKFGFLCSIVSCAADTDHELMPISSWLSYIYPRSAQILAWPGKTIGAKPSLCNKREIRREETRLY
jgi:hypothetical protein